MRRNKLRHPFEQRLIDIRKSVTPHPFDWYRFDSFASLTHFEALLPGGIDSVVKLARDEPVLDMGTGDGDIAFLLESLGCRVVAADWPGTNANEMAGVRLAKRELRSKIEIRELDADGRFNLDGERYGLALALGLLYHVRNPFYFLERLRDHARWCILSTRIMPRGTTKEAVARLTTDREFENDPTNYWIFSEAGMLRLLDRCGWSVIHRYVTGNGEDDRFFCMAASRIAEASPVIALLSGWHEAENGAWRWTTGDCAARIENTAGATRFELKFRKVHEGPLRVQAWVNGCALEPGDYGAPGDYVYSGPVAPTGNRSEIRLRISPPFEAGGRELGVIVRLPGSTIVDEECGIRLLASGFELK